MLLREVDQRTGVTQRVSKCFEDYRHGPSVEHEVKDLVTQRIYGLALGYEDLNDHHEVRDDVLASVLVGKADLLGEHRVRERDRGHPLASASTLNRLELGDPEQAAHSRTHRIAPRGARRIADGAVRGIAAPSTARGVAGSRCDR